jgi:hypothetical protein
MERGEIKPLFIFRYRRLITLYFSSTGWSFYIIAGHLVLSPLHYTELQAHPGSLNGKADETANTAETSIDQ